MKKLSLALFFAVFAAISLFAVPASAQTPTPCAGTNCTPLPRLPTVNVTPDFTGQWTLGFSSGRMNDIGNGWQNFQYTELIVNFTGGSGGSDGSMSFSGNIVGTSGSSVNIFYNPNVTPKYVEMYVYIPEPSIGSGSQYFLQVNIRMFISPDLGYMSGTMMATFYDNLQRSGNSMPTILYHSDVFMSRQGARG